MKQTIVLECDLPEPPQKVWKALTVPELLAQWLMPNDMRPEKGATFSFHGKASGTTSERIDCRVLEIKPHRLLKLSWHADAGPLQDEEEGLDSVVTFELFPTITGGTLLRLVHSGFECGASEVPQASMAMLRRAA
jgi:uncharacterized protein YndB with AHSA1/START domain